tara:strand:+ start:170 stop:541 length:372 start_codon:yes stop_codon:yes gene_type:complete
MKKSDPLDRLNGLAVCPVCGCFDRKGMYRCSECGTFHAGGIMEEREAPPPSEQRELEAAAPPLDPSVYSLGPNASIPEESFDESDDVRSWEGGSTDFTFDEDDDPPVAHITLPEPEDVASDED